MKAGLVYRVAFVVFIAAAILCGLHGAALVVAGARPAAPPPFNCSKVSEIPQAECAALVALYAGTAGSGWQESGGWLTTVTPCSWYGVTCYAGRVTGLALAYNWLSGTIPPDMGNLAMLQQLILPSNELTGGIPPELGTLPYLESLYLGDNQLTGSIPAGLGNLDYLWTLSLSGNQLSGSTPPELGSLVGLQNLDLSENQLTGVIPPAIGGMTNLSVLLLNGNQLSGDIPSELGRLADLRELNLSMNPLTGRVPPQLGNLTFLYSLDLSTTQLVGALPRSFTQLDLSAFDFSNSGLCASSDAAFQTWLAGIADLHGTGNLCGPVAVSVRVTKDGDDVVFQWTHNEPNTGYEVHSSLVPYFAPNAATLMATLPPAITFHRHIGAASDAAKNYFYVVQSKFQDPADYPPVGSNPTGKFSYTLVPGN